MPKDPTKRSQNYKISKKYSPSQLNQTDFGGIYFNVASQVYRHATIEELASILTDCNTKGIPVTIRNTGHSTNGQTLTDGVQVSLEKLKKVNFDKKSLQVSVEAGVSWHELMCAIGLPKHCTQVFPNNPGQQIHVTGNLAVGGIGIFSAKFGGLWHSVESLIVVTMTGEVIECSRTKNPEAFAYSLGGFGRIGVIAEATLKVVESSNKALGLMLLYHNPLQLEFAMKQAMNDQSFAGVSKFHQVNFTTLLNKVGVSPCLLNLFTIIQSDVEKDEKYIYIKEVLKPDMIFPISCGGVDHVPTISPTLEALTVEDIVYMYPKDVHQNQLDLCHPWSDYAISNEAYPVFLKCVIEIIRKHDMAEYMLERTILRNICDFDVFGTYIIKKLETNFRYPLSLDLIGSADYYQVLTFLPTVPNEKVDSALSMQEEITELCYHLGGKKYLYGVHNLTKDQIEQHYTFPVIKRWNELKQHLDPKHLLNIGVIEHLDDMVVTV